MIFSEKSDFFQKVLIFLRNNRIMLARKSGDFVSDLGNKQVMAQNIKYYLERNKLKSVDVCAALGFKAATFSDWLHAKTYPRIDKIEKMANYFGITKADLVEAHTKESSDIPPGFIPVPEMKKVPLVGRIACGTPILAQENIEDYVDVPKDRHVDFCLTCSGDSMIDAGIDDGDTVYIRKQPDVENGEIAAVRIGDDATLKRVYKFSDRVVLQAENRAYPPMTYVGEEMNQITIEGKAVGWVHWV